MKPPVFDIDPAAFSADPYPVYKLMRSQAPIAFVPQLSATLLTRRDDIFACEKNIEVFSSHQPGGLMTVLMGENMMRKDGEEHMAERRMIFPAVSPKTVAGHWLAQFRQHAREILEDLAPLGRAELARDYAMRLSGEALKAITGLTQIGWRDMDAWSQAMIDGIANYAGIPEIEARCRAATAAIDAAIDERFEDARRNPDHSILSVALAAGMPVDNVRHNIKLAISGGQNEPRDAIAGMAFAMLAHPLQLEHIAKGRADWNQAFDEYCRWMAPIGMSPRRIARQFEWNGIEFEPESRAFLMFGAANRDESCFASPDAFDILQGTSKSIAFGAGPHFCAGAWASRALVAQVALPELFAALPRLRLVDSEAVEFRGWAFRGPVSVPVEWDA